MTIAVKRNCATGSSSYATSAVCHKQLKDNCTRVVTGRMSCAGHTDRVFTRENHFHGRMSKADTETHDITKKKKRCWRLLTRPGDGGVADAETNDAAERDLASASLCSENWSGRVNKRWAFGHDKFNSYGVRFADPHNVTETDARDTTCTGVLFNNRWS